MSSDKTCANISIERDSEGWFTLDIDGEVEHGLCEDDVIPMIKEALKEI